MRSSLGCRSLAALAALSLAASCGPSPGVDAGTAAFSAAVSASAVDPGNAGGNKLVTVMTRNLFVGGDVMAPFTVPPDQVLATALAVWGDIQASDFPLRARGIADEIAATQPDLVGLQEVYLFRVTPVGGGDPLQPDLDFLAELSAALEERGLHYRAVAISPHTHLTIPFASLGAAVEMLDRDAILVRVGAGMEIGETRVGDFETRLPVSLAGIEFELTRGWASAEVRKQGVPFLFVTAHLEVRNVSPLLPSGAVQAAQAGELLANVVGDRERVILAGDFNSDADHPTAIPGYWTYGLLGGVGGFTDAWLQRNDPGTGLTCCFEPIRDPAAELYERIDLVLFRGAASTVAVTRTGATADALLEDALGPLWPSDHAGVVATLRLEDPRFFAVR